MVDVAIKSGSRSGRCTITTEDQPDGRQLIVKMTFTTDDGKTTIYEGEALATAIEHAKQGGFFGEQADGNG
jgi:hypothetical protein